MHCIFDREHIDPAVPGLVLLSHGSLAAGLRDAAQVVLGEQDNLAAFCLEPGDDVDAYREAFGEAVSAYPQCVVLLDMKGGTPCNQVLRYAKTNHTAIHAITGASLPMLLEVLAMREGADAAEISATALEAAGEGLVDMYGFLSRTV